MVYSDPSRSVNTKHTLPHREGVRPGSASLGHIVIIHSQITVIGGRRGVGRRRRSLEARLGGGAPWQSDGGLGWSDCGGDLTAAGSSDCIVASVVGSRRSTAAEASV